MSTATPTEAAEVAVSGSMTGTSSSVGAASCSPLLFLSTLNGTGSSPLGSFNYTHHVCISGPGPIQGVDFLLDFSNGDTLYGDLNGTATPSGVPLVSNLSLTYEILGGTGQFLNATGDFAGTGTVDQRFGAPQVSLNFSAVPEPATWAMMLVGMGAIGAAMRRRPARSNVPQLA
jgi:hypothetical protein